MCLLESFFIYFIHTKPIKHMYLLLAHPLECKRYKHNAPSIQRYLLVLRERAWSMLSPHP